MALTIDDLFASPDHYLHGFGHDTAIFVPMDRAAYGRSIFLDGRISPAADGEMHLPLSSLPSAPPPQKTGWIFHVAHCGSTLLARALDRPATNLVLREPLALRQAAVLGDRDRLTLAMNLISRRYRADLPTIVKANVPVNFILPDLAAVDPDARAVFLYLRLEDYLTAILRSDHHREWLRRVTAQLAHHLGDVSGLTDAERAACLWRGQLRAFAAALVTMPETRTLDAEVFFAEPEPVLLATARHLDVPMNEADCRAITCGPLFSTYSKNPHIQFANEDRLARKEEAKRLLREEINGARAWLAEHRTGEEAVLAPLRRRSLIPA